MIVVCRQLGRIGLLLLLVLWSPILHAQETRIAVAANFGNAAQDLAQAFLRETGMEVTLVLGSTGQLYAQISQGAPFHAFLAADVERPDLAVENGFAEADSRFVYAEGELVLYAPGLTSREALEAISTGTFHRIALANPKTAPYGRAALELLNKLGLMSELEQKLVFGNNVAQAFQFVESGAADAGLIARSLVSALPNDDYTSFEPGNYAPIQQGAVLLLADGGNPVARSFLEFLRSSAGRTIIADNGYRVVE